jgi:putative flippase GtrA
MSQFTRFLFAGGIAAAANYGSRFVFSLFMDYEPAIILAYTMGMLVAFILMRGSVFEAKSKSCGPQIAKFVTVNALAVIQTLVISIVLVRYVLPQWSVANQAEALAHAVGVLVPVITSYYGHKLLTFRE